MIKGGGKFKCVSCESNIITGSIHGRIEIDFMRKRKKEKKISTNTSWVLSPCGTLVPVMNSTNTSSVLSPCGTLVPVMNSYGAESNCKLHVKAC
jgi:hypothetical protein